MIFVEVIVDHQGTFSNPTVVLNIPPDTPEEQILYEAECALRSAVPSPCRRPIGDVRLRRVERPQANGAIVIPGGIHPYVFFL